MAITKFLAPVLSAAATAYAASCSSSSTMTVQNAGDASAIGACTTYSGSIAVATSAAGGDGTIDFGNVKAITGDLSYAGDGNVKTINANALQTVKSLNFTNLGALSALNMQQLQQVGDLTLQSLGALGSFNFGTGVSKTGVVTIINTQVSDISAISQASEIDGLAISDNPFLSNMTFNLEMVESVDIGPNNLANGLNINFPKLQTAQSLTLRNATQISTPSLTNITGTLGLYGNKISSYQAPNLTWIGAIVVNDNAQLTNLSFPQLQFINSTDNATLQVANNSKLATIDGFPKLQSVSGDVDFSGNINTIVLGAIKSIAGALNVDTSSSSFDCKPLEGLKDSQVVRGKDNCNTGDSSASGTSGGSGGSGTSSGGSSASSSSAAVPLDLPAFMTGAGIFGGLLAFLF